MISEKFTDADEWMSAAQSALKDAVLCVAAGNNGAAGSYSWEARGYLKEFEKMMADKDGITLRSDFL